MRAARRAVVCVLSVAAAGAVAAGCGSDSGSSSGGTTTAAGGDAEQTVRIAYMPLTQANPYIQATLRGIERTAAAEGGEVVQVFDGGFDAARQFSQCQDAIASGKFDAFIVVPVDASVASCMEEAIDQGIKVANTDFPLGPDPMSSEPQLEGQTATVVDPPALRGRWMFELIQQGCEGTDPCELALLTGAFADPYSQAVIEVIRRSVEDDPAIELVAVKEGGYLEDPSLQATQDILQASPGLDVIATTSDPMTLGAEQAVRAAGKTDQVTLIGGGFSQESYRAIPDGRWIGSFLSLPEQEGELATELVIRAVRGEELSEGLSATEESGLPPVVTEENFAEVEQQLPKAQW